MTSLCLSSVQLRGNWEAELVEAEWGQSTKLLVLKMAWGFYGSGKRFRSRLGSQLREHLSTHNFHFFFSVLFLGIITLQESAKWSWRVFFLNSQNYWALALFLLLRELNHSQPRDFIVDNIVSNYFNCQVCLSFSLFMFCVPSYNMKCHW